MVEHSEGQVICDLRQQLDEYADDLDALKKAFRRRGERLDEQENLVNTLQVTIKSLEEALSKSQWEVSYFRGELK